MRVVGLVSGGKDSCYNLINVVAEGHELVALANLRPKTSDRDELDSMMYQTVGHEVIDLYAEAMDLPLFRRDLEGSGLAVEKDYEPTQGDEVEDLYTLLKEVNDSVDGGVEGVAVGAILSDYQRVRVENVCARLGLTPLAYLWQRDQDELIEEMVGCNIEAILIKVAALGLEPARHLGKTIAELKDHLRRMSGRFGNNVCGEGGEYETLTLDCPLFKKRIVIDQKEIVMHSDDAFAPVAYLKVKKCHLAVKVGHKLSRRELLKLPVKNSMDLADEVQREIDADSDDEAPVTSHVFSSSHSNGPLTGSINTSPSSSSTPPVTTVAPVINLSQSRPSTSAAAGAGEATTQGSPPASETTSSKGDGSPPVTKEEPSGKVGAAPVGSTSGRGGSSNVKVEVKAEPDVDVTSDPQPPDDPPPPCDLASDVAMETDEADAALESRATNELEIEQRVKVAVDREFFHVTGIQGRLPASHGDHNEAAVTAGVMSATRSALETLTQTLNAHGVSTSHLVAVNVYLRKAEHVKAVEKVYQTFFTGCPATRNTIALNIPPTHVLWLDAIGVNYVSQRHRYLHVSSLSHWAPANSAPDAQAVVVDDHLLFASAHKGLIPATLEIVSPDARIQAALVMRHISRVLHVTAHGNAPGVPRNHINVNNVFSAVCYVTKSSAVAVAMREWKRVLRKQMSVKEKSSSNTSHSMRLFVLVPELPKGASLQWQCTAMLPLPIDGSRSSHFRETNCSLGVFKLKLQIVEHCINLSRNYSYSFLATVAMIGDKQERENVDDDRICSLIDFIINNLKDLCITFSSLRVFSLRRGPFRNPLILQKLTSIPPLRSGACQLVPVEGLWLDDCTEVVLALSQAI